MKELKGQGVMEGEERRGTFLVFFNGWSVYFFVFSSIGK